MPWTKQEYIDRVRHHADAESGTRWSPEQILLTINTCFRTEWSNILNTNKNYRWAQRSPSLDANGRFDISDLSSGTGDARQNFFRILAVARGNTIYQQMAFQDAPLSSQGTGNYWNVYGWYQVGEQIQILPLTDANDQLLVFVNWFPALPNALENDDSQIIFPEGYEDVLALEAAAILLAKGGTETDATRDLKALAHQIRLTMLADIARMSTNPIQMAYSDHRGEWAG